MAGWTGVMSRRTFLRELGHGAFALTVVGFAGCKRDAPRSSNGHRSFNPTSTFDPLTYVGNLDEIEAFWCERDPPFPSASQGPSGSAAPSSIPWARIGDVRASGYVLVEGGEATVIDTGPWCVPGMIEGA